MGWVATRDQKKDARKGPMSGFGGVVLDRQDCEAPSVGAASFTSNQCVDDGEDDAYHRAKADPPPGRGPEGLVIL